MESNLTLKSFAERSQLVKEIQVECTRAEKGEQVDLKQTTEKLAGLLRQLNKDGEAINAGTKIGREVRKEYNLQKSDLTGLNARVKALSVKANMASKWVKPVVYTAGALGAMAMAVFIAHKTGILSSPPVPQPPPTSPSPQPPPTSPFLHPVCYPHLNPFVSASPAYHSSTSQTPTTPISIQPPISTLSPTLIPINSSPRSIQPLINTPLRKLTVTAISGGFIGYYALIALWHGFNDPYYNRFWRSDITVLQYLHRSSVAFVTGAALLVTPHALMLAGAAVTSTLDAAMLGVLGVAASLLTIKGARMGISTVFSPID